MTTMVDEFGDVIAFARQCPEWADGFAHALDGVVDFLNANLDDEVDRVAETLSNVLAVFKEHV